VDEPPDAYLIADPTLAKGLELLREKSAVPNPGKE
jgi:hypothetical protein